MATPSTSTPTSTPPPLSPGAAVDVLTDVTEVHHPFLLRFEQDFDPEPYRAWFQDNWASSIAIALAYVVAVFSLRRYMAGRERFGLRPLLGLWSAVLAGFSVLGMLRMTLEMYTVIARHGFMYSVCNPGVYKGVTGFWVLVYTLSKVYELGDTIFIVLRKQKLIFLHWYHHMVTLIYMFFAYKDLVALARWGITQNYVVHSFMYTYYALKAFKLKVPRVVNLFITSIQILQMVVGVGLTTLSFILLYQGVPCQQTLANNFASSIMYASYLILFANFFYRTYISKSKTA